MVGRRQSHITSTRTLLLPNTRHTFEAHNTRHTFEAVFFTPLTHVAVCALDVHRDSVTVAGTDASFGATPASATARAVHVYRL